MWCFHGGEEERSTPHVCVENECDYLARLAQWADFFDPLWIHHLLASLSLPARIHSSRAAEDEVGSRAAQATPYRNILWIRRPRELTTVIPYPIVVQSADELPGRRHVHREGGCVAVAGRRHVACPGSGLRRRRYRSPSPGRIERSVPGRRRSAPGCHWVCQH